VRGRRADVQGIRALAVLLVVAYHVGLLPGGFIGVDVFFVVSGFVIARLLVGELERDGALDLRRFYARRVRRLLPALALVEVIVCLSAIVLLGAVGPQDATADTAIAASVFAANLELFRTPTGYFDLGATANALLHTWSLAVEEQFYLLAPICALTAWRIGRRRGVARAAVFAFASAATIASFALSWLTSENHGERIANYLGGGIDKFAYYMLVTRAWELGAGVLLALASIRVTAGWLKQVLGVVGLVAVVGSAIVVREADPFPGTVALLPVGGTLLLLVAGDALPSMVSRLLGMRPLVWLGDLSYSWYLWHWPLIVFAMSAWPGVTWVPMLAAIVAVGPSWLSFRFLEDPVRRELRWQSARPVALAFVCVLASLSAAITLRLAARYQREGVAEQRIAQALRLHADEQRRCSHGPILGEAPDPCTWSVEGARGLVVLTGDSNAGHFTEAVAAAANAHGLDFKVATRSACPFVDLEVAVPHHDAQTCTRFVKDTIATIVRLRPSLVIVASASVSYVNSDLITFRDLETNETAATREAKARLWHAGTRDMLQALVQANVRVVLIHAVPQLEGLELATCPFYRVRNGDQCGVTIPLAQIHRQQAYAYEAERKAVLDVPSVTAIDFTDELCPEETCSPMRDGAWLYRDLGHLSIAGGRALQPTFERLIATHLTSRL
jgi:peptidoglycan/LPS O-acetylase OafA/YrhL